MKIGIISDSHDNIWNLEKALKELKEKGVETLIHCGDLCAPFIVLQLDELGIPVHVVFGNIDDNKITPKMSADSKNVTHHGETGKINVEGRKIAFTHHPEDAEKLAESGEYDVVFHGHTHKKREEKFGECILINPGEIMGRVGTPSYAIYDTTTKKIEFFDLE